MISIFDCLDLNCLLIAGIIALFCIYCRSTNDYWRKLNVHYLKPIPFFGNYAKFVFRLNALCEMNDQLYKGLGDQPYGGIYQLRNPQLMVKDPQLASAVLVKDFKHFHDHSHSYFFGTNRKRNPLSVNLIVMTGERWRALRQKISPIFTSVKLRQTYGQMLECVDWLDVYLERQTNGADGVDVGLKDLFERLTIDVIGSCGFGIECNSLRSDDQFAYMCRQIFNPSLASTLRFIAMTLGVRSSSVLNLRDQKKEVTDFFLNLTLDTIEYRRQNGIVRNDLLQMLMNLQNSHVDPKYAVGGRAEINHKNDEFDEIDIAANSFLFFIAGFETTSTTLSFCFYELALNENIQKKLRSEVQQVKDKYQTLNYDSLTEMTYMEAVIAETLRKYPPAPTLSRRCTEDYVIPNTKICIPTGTGILIPVWSIHHDWKNYPNPEVFDPERFTGDQHIRPSGVYLPFGDGPRYCVGKRFAELELKATLSNMLLKYDFKPCSKTEIPLSFKQGSITLQTKCGTWVSIKKRKI